MTRREFIEDGAVGGLAFVTCAIQGGSGDVEAQPRMPLVATPRIQ